MRYFIATAEELSVTAAAKRLYPSQPALSRQILALEEELGVPLFQRVKKRIHLTDAGRFFLNRARQLLCDSETSIQQVREHFGHGKKTIRLGFITIFPGRRLFLRGICQSQGFEPVIVEESDSLSLLLVIVASGAGVALLPGHSRKLPHSGCVFVRMKTPVVYAEIMAYKKDSARGSLASLVLHLETSARRVIEAVDVL